jgi:hypothetical protein
MPRFGGLFEKSHVMCFVITPFARRTDDTVMCKTVATSFASRGRQVDVCRRDDAGCDHRLQTSIRMGKQCVGPRCCAEDEINTVEWWLGWFEDLLFLGAEG